MNSTNFSPKINVLPPKNFKFTKSVIKLKKNRLISCCQIVPPLRTQFCHFGRGMI